MTSPQLGMTRVSTEDLLRLLKALHRGTLHEPVTRSALIAGAFGHAEGGLGAIVGRDVASAIAIVAAVLAEREHARANKLDLVHQGPAVPGSRSRSIVDHVLELLASATTAIDICGLIPGEAPRFGRTLTALIEARQLRARFIFACPATEDPAAQIRAFMTGAGLPSGVEAWWSPRAQIRARVVVVDESRTLITSGELTSTEADDTLDAGVVVDDLALARALREEWEKLIRSGALNLVEQ
jgi:hypothetical protein